MTDFRAYIDKFDNKVQVLEREILSSTRRTVTYRERVAGRDDRFWSIGKKCEKGDWLPGYEDAASAIEGLYADAVYARNDAEARLANAKRTIAAIEASK